MRTLFRAALLVDFDVLVFEFHEEADEWSVGFREGFFGQFLEELVAEEDANEFEDGTGWKTGQSLGMVAHRMKLREHIAEFTGMEMPAEASGHGGESAEGRFRAGAGAVAPGRDGSLDFGEVQFRLQEQFVQ